MGKLLFVLVGEFLPAQHVFYEIVTCIFQLSFQNTDCTRAIPVDQGLPEFGMAIATVVMVAKSAPR